MTVFQLRPAEPGDVRQLIDLLANAVPGCSPQTVWSVPWTWSTYSILTDSDGTPIAAGALSDVDGSTVELRGLVVSSQHRGQGLAASVVAHLLDRARAAGKRMVCVTKCPRFFAKLGFQHTAPRWLDLEPQRRLGFGEHSPTARVAMAASPNA